MLKCSNVACMQPWRSARTKTREAELEVAYAKVALARAERNAQHAEKLQAAAQEASALAAKVRAYAESTQHCVQHADSLQPAARGLFHWPLQHARTRARTHACLSARARQALSEL